MSNILKKVCSAQKQYCAEHADSMESGNVEERNRHYRSLKMQAAGAWLFAVPLLLLSIFRDHVTYGNEIQMLLAIPVLLFLGVSLYTDAWKQFRMGRITMDMLIAFSMSVAFLFSLFNTFFPDYWYEVGLQPHVYYEVAVLTAAVGLTGKVFRFLPDELHDGDRMAGIIFPALTGIAILVFVIWILFGGMEAVPHALYSVISIFIVACPCALGLVTPVALMRGIGKAARMHILIKDSLALERLSKADIVVFDKTGTLTEGHPTVIAWLWAQCQEEYFKEVLLAAEMNSTNSLATAISTALREEGITPARLDVCEVLKGKGMRVVYKDAEYWVGSHKLLKDYHVYLSDVLGDMLVEYESEGNSIVYFGRKNELLAIIAVKDQLKAAALGTVRELRARELDICMLTGDGERTASTIAGKLGIIRYMPDALPDDKETFIRELQLQGKMVVMIGDGINDVQALTCADVSIAMGENPDDATVGKTMVVMKSSDLQSLPKLFGLSRHTLRLMHQNSFWMVIYHLIGVLIAAGILYPVYGILLTPMLAAIVILLSCGHADTQLRLAVPIFQRTHSHVPLEVLSEE